jgi:hypothetical protein
MSWTVYEDYIMRQIRAAVRILLHAIGLKEAGDLEAARREMGQAYHELLGKDAHLFSRMDSKTGAALLARPEKMAVMADLFHEEAEILRAAKQGEPEDMDRRALEYALEAFMAAPESEENTARISKLAGYVKGETLETRYREALENMTPSFSPLSGGENKKTSKRAEE